MTKQLVYRVVPHNGGLVFATPERAEYVARIHDAIERSTTWGDFRRAMPLKEYSIILRRAFDEQGSPRPRRTDEFSGEQIPDWSDGGYPPWLQREMEGLVPPSVLQRFGTKQFTHVNGSFWHIPQERADDMCEALASLGWKLEPRPDLHFH